MSKQTRTRTSTKTLTDTVRSSAVDEHIYRARRRLLWIALIILALVVAWALWNFLSDRPVDYDDKAEHYKYGSIGSEPGGSLMDAIGGLLPPEPILAVMPEICPDMLPGGYASLGLLFEEGKQLPIGVSQRRRLGLDQAGLNCAVCHTGTVRTAPDAKPEVVLGMPAHQLHLQDFFRFVLGCTLDERFTPDNVVGRIQQSSGKLGRFDRWLYRSMVVSRTREATLQRAQRLELLMGDAITEWGPGRVDTFNPYKSLQFNWQLDQLSLDELSAASDFPSLWNQKPREGMNLHWDGNNASVDERNRSASLGTGVTPVTLDHERLKRVRDWILDLPAPEFPFPVDQEMARRGEPLYGEHCASCHAFDGEYVGQIEPLEKVGTDPHRLNSYTYLFAANQYTLYPDSNYRFTNFKKTNGYANQPLDGIWARAPYLHNGSVPTLRDLLNPPAERPARFYRGNDLYDPVAVGFVSDMAEENGRAYFEFDVSLPSNSNSGHLYGTYLPDEEKDAIVEYMKTL